MIWHRMDLLAAWGRAAGASSWRHIGLERLAACWDMNLRYHLGVDGISLWLVLLTAWVKYCRKTASLMSAKLAEADGAAD